MAQRSILVICHSTEKEKKNHSYYLWLTDSDDGKFWQMLLKNQKNALKILKNRVKKGAKCDRCDCDIKRVFGESLSCSVELFSSFVSVKFTVIRRIKGKKYLMFLLTNYFFSYFFSMSLQSQIPLTLWAEEQLNKSVEKNSVTNISKLLIMKYIDWTIHVHEDLLWKCNLLFLFI